MILEFDSSIRLKEGKSHVSKKGFNQNKSKKGIRMYPRRRMGLDLVTAQVGLRSGLGLGSGVG